MDGMIYGIQRARMRREIDAARSGGYCGPSSFSSDRPVDTRKGRKVCPECKKTIMSGASKCVECGNVFWKRVNGINVYKKDDGHRRQCPDCGGWLNRHELMCGCGHHFEPMLTADFNVRILLPEGVGVDQMRKYITDSIRVMCGSLSTDDPMFWLDREEVRVKHVTPTQKARKDAKPLNLI
jgi:hypothetical protein